MTDHGPDNLQILICTGFGCAAKQFILDEAGAPTSIPYNAGKRFMPRVVSVNNFDDMATALENLASRPDCFVIRGTLRDDVEANMATTYMRLLCAAPKVRLTRLDPLTADGSQSISTPFPHRPGLIQLPIQTTPSSI